MAAPPRHHHRPAGDDADALATRLDELGRLIAAEWAKDNSIRALDTDDLRRYGTILEEALAVGAVEAAIDHVEAEVRQRAGD